ncbi:MAG: LacI family transcriptional regulator [Oscillospiraceae bacterium]|nr:LacI family transcriptional regulator [Oscillospiraceae bacterium]MDE7172310.1 LacI family transcriptional regulator [Oscillospiraceae bacterium]
MTIKDIARISGVGVATVSRVLNGHPDVSEETRQKVMAIIEERGFQPNANAKHLKQRARSSIAIIVKGTMNMLFADMVEKLLSLLREAGQDTAVYYLDEDANEVVYALQLCRERRPMGMLFLGGDRELFQSEFRGITIPCVLLTNTAVDLGFDNLSSVTTDDREASRQAVRFLAEKGHRRIGILGGNWSCFQIGYSRYLGCQQACQELELPFDGESQCEPCRYSLEDGYTAARVLLERCPDLTAVFAVSDVIALGAIRALHDLGKRVPEDISVMGYDGVAIGQYSLPRLATVRQDTQQLAERGVEALLRSIQRRSPPVHEMIPFQLIEGESVAQLS